MNDNEAILIGIGVLFLLSIVPIMGGFMYARRNLGYRPDCCKNML